MARRLVYTEGGPPANGGPTSARCSRVSCTSARATRSSSAAARFTVAGIYNSGITFEDLGAITTLADAQALAGRTRAETTTIAVRLAPATPVSVAKRKLASALSGVTAISDPSEAVRAGANSELISKAVLLIVVLALIIGALAVANTMLAAVLERRRELALLSTIGWSAGQFAWLVLGEAVAVSMLGTGAGLLLGLIASNALPAALGLQVVHHARLDRLGPRPRGADRRRDRRAGGGLSGVARRRMSRLRRSRRRRSSAAGQLALDQLETRSARSATADAWLTTSTVIP